MSLDEYALTELARLILKTAPGRRIASLQSTISFRPAQTLDEALEIGTLRAVFATLWEKSIHSPVPIEALRAALDPPVPIATVLAFSTLKLQGQRRPVAIVR